MCLSHERYTKVKIFIALHLVSLVCLWDRPEVWSIHRGNHTFPKNIYMTWNAVSSRIWITNSISYCVNHNTSRESSWHNGWNAVLYPQSKPIWTLVVLIHSLSDLWERYKLLYLSSYRWNSITAVLEEWLWH